MGRHVKLRGKLSVCLGLLTLILPARTSADVSVVVQGTGEGRPPKVAWTRTMRIKGLKMRVDFEGHSGSSVHIYDLEAGKRFRLDAKNKEVFVMDLAAESERWRGMLMLQHLRKVIKPTGQQLEVGGMVCDEYTFDLQAPTRPTQGLSSILHDHGTVCVSQVIPGGTDVANYVQEAKKRGYLAAAAPCSPTPSPIGPYFFGEQTNVLVLSARSESVSETPPGLGLGSMSRVENNTSVATIRTDLIPQETFQIPADWKVKKEPDYR